MLVNTAENAAWALKARFETVEALVSRLDDKEMTVKTLTKLVSWVIADEKLQPSPPASNFDETQARAVKVRWQQFLRAHGEKLRAGPLPFNGPALTLDLFPSFEFHPRQSHPLLQIDLSPPVPPKSR